MWFVPLIISYPQEIVGKFYYDFLARSLAYFRFIHIDGRPAIKGTVR